MSFIETYSEVMASVDQITTQEQLDAFIRKIIAAYELKHAIYYFPGMPGNDAIAPVSFISYDKAWVGRYFEADYLNIDPVVSEGFANLLPVDWNSLDRRPPRVKQMFGEAAEHGVGRQGLTFPIRGANGEAALFSVTSDFSDKDWREAKRTYVRDFQIIAHTIHSKGLRIGGMPPSDYRDKLTPRQRECLTWCAVGKTSEDIATILGISEGVVRIHLQSAQHKLNCLNRTHTVAKAMAYKLILPDIR
jgi:LuxR family transcriptional regulator, quorum-sensing system regulator RaiR